MAFYASLDAGGTGIFTSDDLVNAVVRTGDALFGSTVTSLNFFREGLNDSGQLAFYYSLSDGRTASLFRNPGSWSSSSQA